jgi:hypothetical protein
LESLKGSFSKAWSQCEFTVINAQGTPASHWFDDQEVKFILLRPDRYIAALSPTIESFKKDLETLFSN